ncbi:3-mercaptopyruvate sulfurtransferase [Kordiimonas sp.]|uniref:3-mercaptopyruvate sulfurtransferase n=1 Tax=Kordiimonas sp. TaxID=1970157 RepID=UPI003A932E43
MMASPLVSTEWLASRLGDPGTQTVDATLLPVDASWHMPDSKRDAAEEFAKAHIPGAVFFDIDENSHKASQLPHTLQRLDKFQAIAGKLGISNDTTLVIYDDSDVRSAARVWWNFRVMGHKKVYVLDGGLAKWRAEGRALTDAETRVQPATFNATFDPEIMRSADDILMVLQAKGKAGEQILDARSTARFEGTAPEPRQGLRSGHIPGARNLPFNTLFDDDNTLLTGDALRAKFTEAGVDLNRPIIATCGSGVTACVLKLALASLGKHDVAIYDGSWSEWGGDISLPIETGPAEAV